jgi:hypothetical protein
MPDKISSWLILLLQKLPMKEQLWEAHTRTNLRHEGNFDSTLSPLDSPRTSSLTPSLKPSKTRLLGALLMLFDKDSFQAHLMEPLLWEQSAIPSQMFLRPSENTDVQTQQRTETYSLALFYK